MEALLCQRVIGARARIIADRGSPPARASSSTPRVARQLPSFDANPPRACLGEVAGAARRLTEGSPLHHPLRGRSPSPSKRGEDWTGGPPPSPSGEGEWGVKGRPRGWPTPGPSRKREGRHSRSSDAGSALT